MQLYGKTPFHLLWMGSRINSKPRSHQNNTQKKAKITRFTYRLSEYCASARLTGDFINDWYCSGSLHSKWNAEHHVHARPCTPLQKRTLCNQILELKSRAQIIIYYDHWPTAAWADRCRPKCATLLPTPLFHLQQHTPKTPTHWTSRCPSQDDPPSHLKRVAGFVVFVRYI